MKVALPCLRGGGRSAAVVPLQRVQGHQFPRTARDLDDFRERDAMISLLRDIEYAAIDPSRGAGDDWKPRRRALGLHIFEGAVDDSLGDPVHAVRQERD